MAPLAIPEKFTTDLEAIALQENRSPEELVDEAMNSYLSFRLRETPLTTAQIERLQHSAAQLERGEFVSEEQVEAFFADWEKEAASR